MSIANLRASILAAKEESPGVFKGVESLGLAVGAIASLGAVAGLIVAAIAKTLFSEADISYGDWIGYSGALAGLFALVVEVTHRAG